MVRSRGGTLVGPFRRILERQGVVLLDGGLATELEKRRHNLDHPLWSALLLRANPEEISRVHTSYLEAGADCIASASYQATIPGFVAQGMSVSEARKLLSRSIELAVEARDRFVALPAFGGAGRHRPLVAASVGPYGAYLADGSEFRGDYAIARGDLRAFHGERWELFAAAGADVIACETIPSVTEAEVLTRLLEDTPGVYGWISFSCRDGTSVSDGTPFRECAGIVASCERVVAVGVNCTAPRLISSLIAEARTAVPELPVAVYPNSGEAWDAARKRWTGMADPVNFGDMGRRWHREGASLIGGCCRTGPTHIRILRSVLVDSEDHPGGRIQRQTPSSLDAFPE